MLKKLSFATPFLVALFTVITLYVSNANRIGPEQIIAPLLLGLLVAGVFLLLFWLFKPTSAAAPCVSAGFTAAFLIWYTVSWPVWIIALLSLLWVGIRTKQYTTYGSILLSAIVGLGMSICGIQWTVQTSGDTTEAYQVEGSYISIPGQPNIYFIIPDRMPSPAAMREAGIDPDQFVTDLRGLGFYVNEDQVSADPYLAGMGKSFYVETTEVEIHTTRTMRYCASVLNGGAVIPLGISYQDCRSMITDNAAFTWLHKKGYKIINVASWFTETARFTDADQNIIFQDVSLLERFIQNELGEAYLDRTLLRGLNLRALQSSGSTANIEIRRHDWQSKVIKDQAASGGSSTFTIAHIMLPHEPYVYGDPDDSIPDQYYSNIRYAMSYLGDLAGKIRSLDPSAVIIIQSDEGMAYRKPIELNYKLSPLQWSGVMTAWYLPEYTGDLSQIKHTDILGVVSAE